MNTFFHSPNQLTEPEQWLGSATMMLYMFKGAAAFNQPLPETFDTSKVIDVRVSLRVRLDEKPVSDHFLPNFSSSSDAWHVLGCSGLRSTTTFGIRYFCGYGCGCTFVLIPNLIRCQILTSDFYPTYYQMRSMFEGATAFNQPLSTFDTSVVTSVSLHLGRV